MRAGVAITVLAFTFPFALFAQVTGSLPHAVVAVTAATVILLGLSTLVRLRGSTASA